MKKFAFIVTLMVHCFQAGAQDNLNFEQLRYDSSFKQHVPAGWTISRPGALRYFRVTGDTVSPYEGKYSLLMECMNDSVPASFIMQVGFTLDRNFEGKFISVTAWLRSEGLTSPGGITLLSMEGNKTLGSGDSRNARIEGTKVWTKCVSNIALADNAGKVWIGISYSGKGKLWIDQVEIYVNGEPIASAPRKKIYPADNDTTGFTDIPELYKVSKTQTDNLFLLGKVWGFLKYYHPAITKGEVNWDNELLRFLPEYLHSTDENSRDKLLGQWIEKLGKVETCKTCNDSILLKAKHKPDFSWQRSFSGETQRLLQHVKNNHFEGNSQYYIDLRNGIPEIRHEKTYAFNNYPPNGYRLLALFRFWNLVEYWYPNKHLIGEDWNKVLKEFISPVIFTANSKEFSEVLARLVSRINDTHTLASSFALDEASEKYFLPFNLQFIGGGAVIDAITSDSLASFLDLKRGDIIETIDGVAVKELVKQRWETTPGSNDESKYNRVGFKIIRSKNEVSELTINQNGEIKKITVKRFIPKPFGIAYRKPFSYQNDSAYFIIKDGVGYINPGKFKTSDFEKCKSSFSDLRGIIFDLRQYPAGFSVKQFTDWMMPGETKAIQYVFPYADYPGVFVEEDFPEATVGTKDNKDPYKGKIIILVNEYTISAGEFSVMKLQAIPRATIMGSTTAGADGPNIQFTLPGNFGTSFSSLGILYPDGTETQRKGIKIDITVKLTVADMRSGKDVLLEKAIEMINK